MDTMNSPQPHQQHWLYRLAQRLLSDRSKTALVVMLASGLATAGLPVAWIATLALGYWTLERGMVSSLPILLAGLAPAIGLAWYQSNPMLALGVLPIQILVWTGAGCIAACHAWSWMLEMFVLIGAFAMLILYWVFPDVDQWWSSRLLYHAEQAAATLPDGQAMDKATLLAKVEDLAMIASAVQFITFMMSSTFGVVLASYWQAWVKRVVPSFRESLYQLQASWILNVLAFACLIGAYLGDVIAWNILLICGVPYVLSGLSFTHYAGLVYRFPTWAYWCFYFVLVLFFQYVVWLFIAVAVIDSIFTLRRMLVSHSSTRS